MSSSIKSNFRFSCDRGGTFTDIYAEFSDEQGNTCQRVLKLLSVDPDNYPDAPWEGIRRVLELETGIPHPRDQPLDTSRIASIRMGTTVRYSDIHGKELWSHSYVCDLQFDFE
jgi:5-oxoprolinase (ATP-hydrolysing)